MSTILVSAALGLSLISGIPLLANAEEDTSTHHSLDSLLISNEETNPSSSTGLSISNYFGQVFQSPYQTPGAIPVPTDSKYDSKEVRNRAYDEAFERDARDRDAYYGRMAAAKREQAAQEVKRNREALGLDGPGDVRMRVGEEKVAGMASLRAYLLEQDPSTLTPAELEVYERMKAAQ